MRERPEGIVSVATTGRLFQHEFGVHAGTEHRFAGTAHPALAGEEPGRLVQNCAVQASVDCTVGCQCVFGFATEEQASLGDEHAG